MQKIALESEAAEKSTQVVEEISDGRRDLSIASFTQPMPTPKERETSRKTEETVAKSALNCHAS